MERVLFTMTAGAALTRRQRWLIFWSTKHGRVVLFERQGEVVLVIAA